MPLPNMAPLQDSRLCNCMTSGGRHVIFIKLSLEFVIQDKHGDDFKESSIWAPWLPGMKPRCKKIRSILESEVIAFPQETKNLRAGD
jgi:hypothetical protein